MRLFRVAYIAGLVLVSALSLWPHPDVALDIAGIDRLGHLLAYGLIATVGALGQHERTMKLAAVIFAIAVGIALELAQLAILGRSASVIDIVANSLGAGAGLAVAAFIQSGRTKRSAR